MEKFFNNLLFQIVKILLYSLFFLELIILYIIINHIKTISFEDSNFATLVIMATVGSLLFVFLLKYYSELKDQIKKNNPKQIKS